MEASPDLTEATDPSPITQPGVTPKARVVRRPAVFLVFVGVLTALFSRVLFNLFASALDSELNSYIILIPFVSLYVMHLGRARLVQTYKSSFGWAAITGLAGITALTLLVSGFGQAAGFTNNDRLAISTFAFVSLLWSGGFILMGRRWMAAAAFPMFFLIFLVPLPDRVVYWMELGLRWLSADAANLFFALSGTPVLRTGTIFQLPGITLEVAQECSGIRSSWILFITSLVAAELFLTKRWSKVILICSVLPLGVLRNGFRIMVIGLLCVHIDPDMIHSIIHRRGGPIFFALSLVPLLLLMGLLRKRELSSTSRSTEAGSVTAN